MNNTFNEDEFDKLFEEDDDVVNNLQKIIIQQRLEEEKTKLDKYGGRLGDLFKCVGTFLKTHEQSIPPYRITGGAAVSAWLNPKNENIPKDQLQYLITSDWDIEILGNNEQALDLAKRIKGYLVKECGKKDITDRFDTVVVMSGEELKGLRVYQIGLDDINETRYFVDVHGQIENNFQKNNIVKLDGLRYPNLKTLISDTENCMVGEKMAKRYSRVQLLQKAIQDIKMFNPDVYREICQQCISKGVEKLTGFNLNCNALKKLCES